ISPITLSVQLFDTGGISTIGSSGLFTIADAPLTVTAVNSPRSGLTEGQSSGTFTVAAFSDAYAGAPLTDFTAVINWGDGSTSTVTSANGITGSAGNFVVQTAHIYTDAIAAPTVVSVQILDVGGSSASGSSSRGF